MAECESHLHGNILVVSLANRLRRKTVAISMEYPLFGDFQSQSTHNQIRSALTRRLNLCAVKSAPSSLRHHPRQHSLLLPRPLPSPAAPPAIPARYGPGRRLLVLPGCLWADPHRQKMEVGPDSPENLGAINPSGAKARVFAGSGRRGWKPRPSRTGGVMADGARHPSVGSLYFPVTLGTCPTPPGTLRLA
jgi:hypothetical protein